MPMTTAGKLLGNHLYAFVYGETGCGKTLLPLTLRTTDDASDIGWVTAEGNGPTSLATSGYPNAKVWVVEPNKDPFEQTLAGLKMLGADKAIKTVCLDGLSVLSGRAIDFFSGGAGEKALGFEGWGVILNNFRNIEKFCEHLWRQGRNVILTAWEAEPVYETVDRVEVLKFSGSPYLQGQARKWLPGNVDILARMTAKFSNAVVNGKPEKVFTGQLHLNKTGDWNVRTKWTFLKSPYPANLKQMLTEVQAHKPTQPKLSVPMAKAPTVKRPT